MRQIELSDELWARMQKYAKPLVDTPETVIARGLDALDKLPGRKSATAVIQLPEQAMFRTSRGEFLPVGLEMFAEWRGKKLSATVTASGIESANKLCDGPSPAARAAMMKVGATTTEASVNGWKFWQMKSPIAPNRVCSIDYYRKKE